DFQTRLLLLHQDALRDIHEHRARKLAAGVRLGPPLNPEWFTIVLAPQFEDHPTRVRAFANRLEGLAHPALRVGRVGCKSLSVSPCDFFGFDAKNPHGGSIGPDESGIEAFMHVGNWRFVEQIAKS